MLDENSLIRRIAHKREIHQLNTEIEHYRKQYEEDSKLLKEITSNKEALEKVAREKYLMKKENEDIFILKKTMMESKMKDKLAVVGAIVLFVGLALQFVKLAWAPYVYLAGACLFAYVQLVSDYKGKNIIIRRLRRQQLLGAMLLVLTGVIMLLWKRNEWIVCLTVAAVLELYTAFRIPQEEAKEN